MHGAQVVEHVALAREHPVADGTARLAAVQAHVVRQRGAQRERLAAERARETARGRPASQPASDCSAAYRHKREPRQPAEGAAAVRAGGFRTLSRQLEV